MEQRFVNLYEELSRCDETQAVEAAVGALNRDEKFAAQTPQHALFDLYQRIHEVSFYLRDSDSSAAKALEQFLDRIEIARQQDVSEVKEYFDWQENRHAAAQLEASQEDTPERRQLFRRVATLRHYAALEWKDGRIGPFSIYLDDYQREVHKLSLIRKFSDHAERMVRAAKGDYGLDTKIDALYDAQTLGLTARKDKRAKSVFESFVSALDKEPAFAKPDCSECLLGEQEPERAEKTREALSFAERLRMRDRSRPAADCAER